MATLPERDLSKVMEEQLLEWGADKIAVNVLGRTALHEATHHNRQDVVQLLIMYSANINAKPNWGTLAKDVAILCEFQRMLEDIDGTGKGSSNPATTAAVSENVPDEPNSSKKKPEASLPVAKATGGSGSGGEVR